MACVICNHEHREEIEALLMASDYGTSGKSMSDIANEYNVSVTDLQVHALMHSPATVLESEGVQQSIAGEVKKREASLLAAMADEYYATLKVVGRDLRSTIMNDSQGGALKVTRQEVDLYIGTGNNLRSTLESIVTINQKINGEKDSGLEALTNVIAAIRGSK